MIHLITVNGKSAKSFYLDLKYLSDFKSLMRTVTSGRVLIVSTKFRTDLFYNAEQPKNDEILKLWALYANTNLSNLDQLDYTTCIGNEESLSTYFLSINKLAANWYHYRVYKKIFLQVFNNDQQNPVARTVLQCDQYLIENTNINRTPLVKSNENSDLKMLTNTFDLVMRYINKKNTPN